MDEELLRQAEKFEKKLKFPMNQDKLDKQSWTLFGYRSWPAEKQSLMEGLLEEVTLRNLIEIKSAIKQATLAERKRLLGLVRANKANCTIPIVTELAEQLNVFIFQQVNKYIDGSDSRLELVNMPEFTETSVCQFKKQALQKLPLYEYIQTVVSESTSILREYVIVQAESTACFPPEWLHEITGICSDIVCSQVADSEFAKDLAVHEFRQKIPATIAQATTTLKTHFAAVLPTQVAHIFRSLRSQEIQPFDVRYCNANGCSAFLSLAADHFHAEFSHFLWQRPGYMPLRDLAEARSVFLLTTSFGEKVFCLVSLVIAASRLFEALLGVQVANGLVYSPEVRAKLQSFSKSLASSDSTSLLPFMMNRVEFILAGEMRKANIQTMNENPQYDFSEVIDVVRSKLTGSQIRARYPNTRWNRMINIVGRWISDRFQQANPFPIWTKPMKLDLIPVNRVKSFHMLLCFSGWTSESDKLQEQWAAVKETHESLAAYTVRWSSVSLKTAKEDLMACFHTPGSLSLKVIFAAIRAALIATSFFSARARAMQTGKLIADLIAEGFVNYKCGVSLVGFSLGTEVIISCLEHLADRQTKYIQDVVLMGSAVKATNLARLRKARSAVAGRFINVYCRRDSVLKFCFGIPYGKAVGLGPVFLEGSENYDVTSFVKGHSDYDKKKNRIFEEIGFHA